MALAFSGQPASAQTAIDHLQRLQSQARAFLATLEPVAPVTAASVEQQLQMTTSNSVWSRQMVTDDVTKVEQTAAQLEADLQQEPTPDALLAAKSTVEGLARRLRVSSAALSLTPESKTQLDFLMLELEESAKVIDLQREQMLAQYQQQRRSRSSIGIGFGYGYGGWGVPYGWGSYYPYGNDFGVFPGYPGFPGFPGFVGGGGVYGVGPSCR